MNDRLPVSYATFSVLASLSITIIFVIFDYWKVFLNSVGHLFIDFQLIRRRNGGWLGNLNSRRKRAAILVQRIQV